MEISLKKEMGMNFRKIISLYCVFIFLLSFLFLAPEELSAEVKKCKVPKKYSEESQWCWAACTASVLGYFKKKIQQCNIVNFAWSLKTCCDDPAPCNNGHTPSGMHSVLKHWCVSSQKMSRSLSFSELKTEIKLKRPIIIGLMWAAGGGHALVAWGYNEGDKQKVYTMDPAPGKGYGIANYEYLKHQANGWTWTHTLRKMKLTRRKANWKVINSAPAALKSSSGYPYWRYNIHLKEVKGGCGEIKKFYIEHYTTNDSFLGRDTFTKKDFAEWFVDCGEGEAELPRRTKFCSDGNETHLGGETSGFVKWTFEIECDSGPSITVSKKFALPRATTAAFEAYPQNITKSATRKNHNLLNSINRVNQNGNKHCKTLLPDSSISRKKEAGNE